MKRQRKPEIEPPPPLTGRPSKYTPQLAAEICDRMTNGKGLREICSAPDMPHRSTVLRWLDDDRAGFRDRYARAREALMDFYQEEILKIAFDDSGDFFIDGDRMVSNHAAVQRAKLKVDALKWLMSKLHARVYGDRIDPPAAPEEKIVQIKRVIIDSPGSTMAPPVPSDPLLIEYTPKLPAPGDLPSPVQARLRSIFQNRVRSKYENPYATFDEVCTVIDRALAAHYGTE